MDLVLHRLLRWSIIGGGGKEEGWELAGGRRTQGWGARVSPEALSQSGLSPYLLFVCLVH